MNLRDYQVLAVDGVFEAWKSHASTLVVLPTGCGKTVVFAEVIRRLSGNGRVLVLAHREELVFQARDKIAAFAGIDADIEMAELRAGDFFGKPARVVVSTIQTQGSGAAGHERMMRFDPADFTAIIVDEAHHATSPSYRRVINRYLTANPSCRLLGVTATPDRHDEQALGQVFASVAYSYEIAQAIADGWLVPIRQQLVTVSSLDFSAIRTQAGDFNQSQLAAVMEEEENLHRIAAPTLEICRDKRALVFTASVAQAERLCEILNRSTSHAEWLCGETSKDERRAILGRFKAGETQYLVNVGVLTEGFDDAGVEVVVMARPTKSRALYAQMVGRGTRPAADIAAQLGAKECPDRRALIAQSVKPSCLVIDFVGNAGRHKLVSAADILGGKYPEEVVEEVKRRLLSSPGNAAWDGDVSEALEAANREREERQRREAEKRRQVRATAYFSTREIDPFDRYDLAQYANVPQESCAPILARDDQTIRKAFGEKNYEKMTPGAKQALAQEIHRRERVGQCSLRQEKFLAKRGIFVPMRKAEARRAIDIISKQEGWAA